jgi:DNA-3-methyladenine glycosylase
MDGRSPAVHPEAPQSGNATRARRARPVSKSLLEDDPVVVGPRLLNLLLAHGDRVARIVEVEAYRGERDPASHAYRGETPRNAVMFGPAGRLYVYFTYGMHYCANVVCDRDGVAGAVLLRAAAPVAGLEGMRASRPAARSDRELLNGPAKLCQALGIGRADNGTALLGRGPIRLLEDGTPPPRRPRRGPRVGINVATEVPWRFWVPGDPHVSGPARLR